MAVEHGLSAGDGGIGPCKLRKAPMSILELHEYGGIVREADEKAV